MMQHIATEQLIDYIHGALAPADDAHVLVHLEGCSQCRAEYDVEARLSEMLREQAALETRDVPSTIKARLWQLIRDSQPSYGARLRAWLRPAYAIPVAAAIVVAAYFAPAYFGHHENAPLIDAAYYLQDHAAMNGSVPFGDRSGATPVEFESGAALDQTAVNAVPVVYTAYAAQR